MRILILSLVVFCLLPTAWSEIQFEDVSHQAGITRIGESWGNAWGDFDGDGYLDLWVTNHKHKPSLYRNNGDGTFTDIIDEVWNAYPFADTHGVAWADFDNDGDQDLIVLCGGGGGTNRSNITHYNHFYVNENGKLIERAAEFGIDMPLLRGRAPLWFDWNRDGLLDLLVTGRTQTDPTGALVTSTIFAQIHGGFENVNAQSGFHIEKDAALAQLADVTGDGAMELFIDGSPYPAHVYDTSISPFNELTATLNFPKIYSVQDATFADFNGDLVPDAFLARGVYRSFIDISEAENVRDSEDPLDPEADPYKIRINVKTNIGEKGFSFKTDGIVKFEVHSDWASQLHHLAIGKDAHNVYAFDGGYIPTDRERNVSSFTFVLDPADPMVVGLADRPKNEKWRTYVGYDPDSNRWTVLYHTMPPIDTNWTGFEALISSKHPILEVDPINFSNSDLFYQPNSILYITARQNNFRKVDFTEAVEARSVAAGDFDNDMDVDIYIVRSNSAANLPNQLYENQGDGTFIQLPRASGAEANTEGKGMSVTMGDYDMDGYLDLFVTNGRGVYPYNNGPDQIFRNVSSGNNWIQIDLEGKVSNRDGIGARLFATTPDGKTQLRERNGGIHWSQQDQKRIHFGLGQNEVVSELIIHWPSGILQKLTDVEVNQVLRVVEDGIQTSLTGDVNIDGQVDIIDLLVIVAHFGESPPSNSKYDTNKDGKVDLQDVIIVIKSIEENQNGTAAPAQPHNVPIPKIKATDISSLSDHHIALLHAFYEKIEELSDDATQIDLVKRFLENLLMPADGPLKTKLFANYPNPFNPETWIPYQLAEDAEITIRVYNTAGETVRTLFIGHQTSGFYISRGKAAYWDGSNEFGEAAASGLYFYELSTPTSKQTRKLVIIK